MADPPRDPVVWLLWRVWLAVSRPDVTHELVLTLGETDVVELTVGQQVFGRVEAWTRPDGAGVKHPAALIPPLAFEVDRPDVVRIEGDDLGGVKVTGLAPGQANVEASMSVGPEKTLHAQATVNVRFGEPAEITLEFDDPFAVPA